MLRSYCLEDEKEKASVMMSLRYGGSSFENIPLVEITPDVGTKNNEEEESPAGEGTGTTAEAFTIQKETHGHRSEDLSQPVEHVVQGSCTDVEDASVVCVEF